MIQNQSAYEYLRTWLIMCLEEIWKNSFWIFWISFLNLEKQHLKLEKKHINWTYIFLVFFFKTVLFDTNLTNRGTHYILSWKSLQLWYFTTPCNDSLDYVLLRYESTKSMGQTGALQMPKNIPMWLLGGFK